MEVIINNKRIIEFFERNSDINIETFILKNIDFYEYVLSSVNDNNTAQILPYILSQSNLINNLIEKQNKMDLNIENVKNSKISLINEVEKLRNDNINNIKDIQNLILTNNVEYMNKTKEIIYNLEKNMNATNNKDIKDVINIISNFDKRLIENNNYLMSSINTNSDKDILSLTKDIELITTKSFKDIKDHIDLLKEKSPKEFEDYFDKIMNELIKNDDHIIQNIKHLISNEFNFIKSSIDDTKISVNSISNIFLHKNSSNKGRMSENILETLLSQTFPNYTIERTSSDSHSGDFILTTSLKPSILIENKDYDKNVNKDEIDKFIRDIDQNNLSGILISQHSGISNKHNFSIEFHNNNILLYIHNCKYDMDKIQLAVDIIYSLHDYMTQNDHNDSKHFIDNFTFDSIQHDYLLFIKNRNDIISQLNASIKSIRKMDIPSIKLLLEKFSNKLTVSTNSVSCSECSKIFSTISALSAHKKKHFNERKKLDISEHESN